MIDKNNLPIDATNTVLTCACNASIGMLLNARRNIDEQKLTEAYQIQDMLLEMIDKIKLIKEGEE